MKASHNTNADNSAAKQAALDAMMPQLQGEIKKGVDFVKGA